MAHTRTIARLPSVLSSSINILCCRRGPALYTPLRLLATEHNQAALDQFLGHWVEVNKKGVDELAKAAGFSKDFSEFFKKIKTEVIFTRQGDDWILQRTYEGHPTRINCSFKFGVPYHSVQFNGSPVQITPMIHGKSIMEMCESIEDPKYTMVVERNVSGNEMNCIFSIDAAKMTVTYKKK